MVIYPMNNAIFYCLNVQEAGGLMVGVLDSGASAQGLSPGQGLCVGFLGRHFTLMVPLSTQVYK